MKKLVVILSAFTVAIFTSCKTETKEKEVETQFLVTNPIMKDTVITKDYVSQIQSFRHIELRAMEKGYLQQIFVDEG